MLHLWGKQGNVGNRVENKAKSPLYTVNVMRATKHFLCSRIEQKARKHILKAQEVYNNFVNTEMCRRVIITWRVGKHDMFNDDIALHLNWN